MREPDAGFHEQLISGIDRDDLCMIHDGDAVAEDFSFIHVMRREDDGFSLGFDHLHEVPQIAAGLRIQAGGGLVEEKHLRIVDQSDGDGKSLLLAAGKFASLAAGLFGELHFAQELAGVYLAVVAGGEGMYELDEGEVFKKAEA